MLRDLTSVWPQVRLERKALYSTGVWKVLGITLQLVKWFWKLCFSCTDPCCRFLECCILEFWSFVVIETCSLWNGSITLTQQCPCLWEFCLKHLCFSTGIMPHRDVRLTCSSEICARHLCWAGVEFLCLTGTFKDGVTITLLCSVWLTAIRFSLFFLSVRIWSMKCCVQTDEKNKDCLCAWELLDMLSLVLKGFHSLFYLTKSSSFLLRIR